MLLRKSNIALLCFCTLFFFFSIKINAQNENVSDSLTFKQTELEQSVDLQILTWNIQLLPVVFWPFHWRFRSKQCIRIPWITSHLNEQDYDVIVFQEIFSKSMTRKIRKQLKSEYPYQVRPQNKKCTLKFRSCLNL